MLQTCCTTSKELYIHGSQSWYIMLLVKRRLSDDSKFWRLLFNNMLSLVYIFTSQVGQISAYPIASMTLHVVNTTALHTDIATDWVSSPNGRGTWDILYGCVCTLIACVYTAIHLNIPPNDEKEWRTLRRKLKWIFIALFAAEIVVYTAFEQWYLGRKFLKKLISQEEAKVCDLCVPRLQY